MPDGLDVRVKRGTAPGEDYFRRQARTLAERGQATGLTGNRLDSEAAREEHRRLLHWFYYEKDRQAANRLEMAIDADFYDNLQWDPEDAEILRKRGQLPLVYNEIAPMVDWVIGTERRARVDWHVLPRAEDDVALAEIKTKVLKYVADLNRVQFVRSRAFADAIKVGVGWLDDGVRDDPTEDVLYSRYEDWRNVLWDSAAYEHDLSDARYVFRWRWVDEDVALAMFPQRRSQIARAVEEATHRPPDAWEEDSWQTAHEHGTSQRRGTLYATGMSGSVLVDAKRRRVRLIECQYRKPAKAQVVTEGPFRGAMFNAADQALAQAVSTASIVEKVMMRTHIAIFTEGDLLAAGPSIFRHNRYTLTPVWCYRRSRDRLPYGVIRRVRDMQQDLNKRASKALFLLNTNQVIADEGAVDDWDMLRDEADRPDGLIIKKAGRELDIRRDTDAATGQIEMMQLAAQSIQKSAGVGNENLGRQTNAISGEAIKARQLQGSVVTTEPFDNLRLATQIQGEKQLSLVEQFYTEEKVIRLTGSRGALQWVRINQPEVQPDGSVRWINDITRSMADFVVSEQDYAGTLRQVMFESLNQLAGRLPPEVALRLMTVAVEYSDLPNKDEIAEQLRKMTGERDPNKQMTPEEQAQAAQQAQMQAEAMELQRQTDIASLEEQQAKVREINARAAKLEAEAAGMGAEGAEGVQQAVAQVRQQADQQIERLSEALRKAQAELANRTLEIDRDADTQVEVARIEADAQQRVAEIQRVSDAQIAALDARLDKIEQALKDAPKKEGAEK